MRFLGCLPTSSCRTKNICHHCGSFCIDQQRCKVNVSLPKHHSSGMLVCHHFQVPVVFLPSTALQSIRDLRKPGCVSELGFLAEHPRSPIHAPACAQGLLALLVIPATCRRKQQPNARSCLLPAQCFVPAVL